MLPRLRLLVAAIHCLVAANVLADGLPAMEGAWTGTVRQVSSGTNVDTEVARGGAMIQDVELTLSVFHQDGEVFIGESASNASNVNPPVPVWGAIRSTGKEGVFVTSNGGRGHIWFLTPTRLEFCFGNNAADVLSSYCGILDKR